MINIFALKVKIITGIFLSIFFLNLDQLNYKYCHYPYKLLQGKVFDKKNL